MLDKTFHGEFCTSSSMILHQLPLFAMKKLDHSYVIGKNCCNNERSSLLSSKWSFVFQTFSCQGQSWIITPNHNLFAPSDVISLHLCKGKGREDFLIKYSDNEIR